MDEENTVVEQTENAQENENSSNDETQTAEGTTASQTDSEDGEKQEESHYEKELRELKESLKKKDEIIEHKNRALKAEKEKNKDSNKLEKNDELLKRLSDLESKFGTNEVQQVINTMTSDKAEKELIQFHYDNSIVKTGDIIKDTEMALAIANQSLIMEQRSNKAYEEGNENFLATFSKNKDVRGEMASRSANPVERAAEDLVRSINPNAVKFVKEQFK